MRPVVLAALAALACSDPVAPCEPPVLTTATLSGGTTPVTLPLCGASVLLRVAVTETDRVTVSASQGHLTTTDTNAAAVEAGFAFEPSVAATAELLLTGEGGSVVPVTVSVEPFACTNDAREPNDDVEHAAPLVAPGLVRGRVCFDEVDAFAVDVPADRALEVHVTSPLPDRIRLDALPLDAPAETVASMPEAAEPTLRTPASPETRRWVVRVTTSPATRLSYTLTVVSVAPGDTGAVAAGTVRYLKRIGAPDGSWTTAWRPARRVDIDVLAGDAVVASGRTGEAGEFVVSHPPGSGPSGSVRVRAVAQASGSRLHVEVDDLNESPWAAESGTGPLFDIDVSEPYAAGAFNIVEQAVLLADALDGVVDAAPPKLLRVHWAPDLSPPCGSCFYDDDGTLDVSGLTGEEDAHDDSVILHELGHWVEATWGRYDNPGGIHDLQPVQPKLAWSEGFATWLQGAVRGSSTYLDLRPDGSAYVLDLESPPDKVKGGSESELSEGLVYGVLWDLIDAGATDEDEAHFATSEVLAAAVTLSTAPDHGATGADFVDFLNAWRCAHPAGDAALAAVLAAFDYPPVAKEPTCP